MPHLKPRFRNRPGFTLVLAALMFTIFMAVAAMAIDVGHARLRRSDAQAAADAAALAGIIGYAKTSDAGTALADAQLYAGKFRADTTHLTVLAADFALGHCPDGFCSNFTTPAAAGTVTNAARVIVRDSGGYMFGNYLAARMRPKISATAIAIGVSGNVTRGTCISPVVISYADVLKQLGLTVTDTSHVLSQTDLAALGGANGGKTDTLDIPNGVKVTSDAPHQWVQINVPPAVTAPGADQNPGPPSTSDYRNAFGCTGNPNTAVGVGDWLQPINGVKANATQSAIMAIAPNGSLPVTLEVMTATGFGTPGSCNSGGINGCLQVKYLMAFTVTKFIGNGSNTQIIGYFSLVRDSGGVVTAGGNTPSAVLETKTRLVY